MLFALLLVTLFFAFKKPKAPTAPTPRLDTSVTAVEIEQKSWPHRYGFALHPTQPLIAWVEKSSSQEYQLVVSTEDGGTLLLKELGEICSKISLAWSPSGDQLAATWHDGATHLYLFQHDKLAYQTSVLMEHSKESIASLAWLDEQHLLLSKSEHLSDEFHLFTLSLTNKKYQLYRDAKLTSLVTASEGHVAFVKQSESDPVVMVVNDIGQEVFRYRSTEAILELTLLPSLEGLLVVTSSGPKVIMLTGQERPLDSLPTHFQAPQLSHQQQGLYFLKPHLNLDLGWAQITPDLLSFTPLEQSPGQDHMAKCRTSFPDLVFISDRAGTPQLWLHSEQSAESLIINPAHDPLADLLVSPDKQHLIYKLGEQVVLLNMVTREQQLLLEQAANIHPLGLDASQQYFYYSELSDSEDRVHYLRMDIASGRSETLDIPDNYHGQAIISEGIFYFVTPLDSFLHHWSPEGSQAFNSFFPHDARFIAENSQNLYYYLPRRGQHRQIWAYHKQDGSHKVVLASDQYQGKVVDICDDNRVLLEQDRQQRSDLFRVSSQNLF